MFKTICFLIIIIKNFTFNLNVTNVYNNVNKINNENIIFSVYCSFSFYIKTTLNYISKIAKKEEKIKQLYFI
jgi:hypothetical protein